MPRTCENCQIKMPAFRPRRKTEDGRLVCDGCHPGGRGDEGRPIGMHGARTAGEKNPYRYHCGDCGGYFPEMGEYNGSPVCPRCYSDDLGEITDSGEYEASLHRVAHDSGDGETIYHCPFCGGGQVVGRSDGTVECDFCQTAFTVQVQPQQNAQPQTFDGNPLDMPGMPGEGGETPAGEAPPADPDSEFAVIDPDQPSPVAPQGQDGGPQGPPTDINAEFAVISSRYYLTRDGAALDGNRYLRHLALRYADDPGPVLAEIRRENGRGR